MKFNSLTTNVVALLKSLSICFLFVRGRLASYFTNYSGFRPDFLQVPKQSKK